MTAMEEFFDWCEQHEADPKVIVRARKQYAELRAALYDFDHPRRQRKAMKIIRELAEEFAQVAIRVRRH